jgi:hypothetical protein
MQSQRIPGFLAESNEIIVRGSSIDVKTYIRIVAYSDRFERIDPNFFYRSGNDFGQNR